MQTILITLLLLACTSVISYIVLTITDELIDFINKAKHKSKLRGTKRG